MQRQSRLGSLVIASVVGFGLAVAMPAEAGGFNWFGLKKSDSCDAVDGACADGACADGACADGACAVESCDGGSCQTGPCLGGPTCGPGQCSCYGKGCGGPKWHSEEWYAMRAHLPPGERPKCKHGKMTPVEPRPNLPEQPYWHKYHSVKNWPHPYDCVDRNAVRGTLETMTNRGWVDVATLHPHHFDPQSQSLNAAGIAKVNYVLTGVPLQHRALYISDANRQMTQARVANVRAALVDIAGNADAMAVMPRTADNPARPAIEVERVNRARLEGMLPPVITYDNADTN